MSYFRFLSRRLRNVGLEREHARLFAHYFDFQVKHQGLRGAVTHFKKVGDCIVSRLAGEDVKPSWLRTTFRYPKKLVFLREYPVQVQARVAKVARAIRYNEFTPAQSKKVLDAVLTPQRSDAANVDMLTNICMLGLHGLPSADLTMLVNPVYPQIGRQFRKVQSVSGPTKVTMEPPIAESFKLLEGTVFTDLPLIDEVFFPLKCKHMIYKDHFVKLRRDPKVVGEIHAAQEGGGKMRMFAAPYTIFQVAITPLHECLAKWSRAIPSDCILDQEKGVEWVRRQFGRGKRVASVDLRTATCRFPLETQIAVMKRLGIPQVWIDCFVSLARGKWRVSKELQSKAGFPKFLRWLVGQPLGTRPSMSLFSSAHNLVLRGLCFLLGLNPNTSFQILGDDAVMIEELRAPYIAIMTSAGVEISWEKSHLSHTFAEFAGYSIFSVPPPLNDEPVRPGQWQEPDRNNFLELAMHLGHPLQREVSTVMLEIQKMFLFMAGLYDPEPGELTKFLRFSSRKAMADLTEPKAPKTTKYWSQGFREQCFAQLGTDCRFYHFVENDLAVFRSLSDLTTAAFYERFMSYQNDMEETFGLGGQTFLAAVNPEALCNMGTIAVYDAACTGEITWDNAVKRLKQLDEDVSRLFYLPPKQLNAERVSGAKLRKLASWVNDSSDILRPPFLGPDPREESLTFTG